MEKKNEEFHDSPNVEEWVTGKKKNRKNVLIVTITVIIIACLISWTYYSQIAHTPDNENAELELILNVITTNGTISIQYQFNNLGGKPATIIQPGHDYSFIAYNRIELHPALKINFTDSTGKSLGTIIYSDIENITYPTTTINPGEYGPMGYCRLFPWDWFANTYANDTLSYEYRNTTGPYYISLSYDSTLFQNDNVWKGQLVSNTVILNEIPVTPTATP